MSESEPCKYEVEVGQALDRDDRKRLDYLLMLEVVASELVLVGITKACSSLLKLLEPISALPRSGWRLTGNAISDEGFALMLGRVMAAEDQSSEERRERRVVSWVTEREMDCWPEKTSERALGVPYRTVQAWARECEELGLISRTRSGRGRRPAGRPQFELNRHVARILQ